jgi:integrative and conjugative element protein (TIGR02256 family)
MRARCWLAPGALDEILNEAGRWCLRETGGALLGWRERDDVVVTKVLGPGPKAKHGFNHFEPDAPWQAAEGARIYHETGRTVAYVGDWHTHPRGRLAPSRQDRKAVAAIAADPDFRAPRALTAILGRTLRGRPRSKGRWRIAIYMHTESGLEQMELLAYPERRP